MKRFIITFYLICVFSFSKAQGDITLYSMRELYQSTYLNPAFISTYNQSIGVPALSNISIALQLTGFNIGNILKNINSDSIFNLTNFYHDINDGIGTKVSVQTDFLHYSKQFGHYQIGFNLSLKTNAEAFLSKDFVAFIAEGNAAYAGQNVSLTGSRIQSTAYFETGISIAREFKKFTIGARVNAKRNC